jgi:hypothetical protein
MGLSASKKVSEDIGYVRTSNIADDEFEWPMLSICSGI